nr:hypothetical protein [Tanacetum cinerariifolium]
MSYLTDYEKIDGGYVAFGGNSKGGKITRKYTIKTDNLDFENVYFVRELKLNLFSVSKIYDKKNSILFNDTECIVLSPNFKLIDESKVLLRVHRKNNMYSVDLKNIILKGGNLVMGLPSILFENDQTCIACQKKKQHKAFCKSKTENSISLPLHLLHMDLFGPTFVKSLKKKMYCLVVTNDYSRFTWVFFLATKDETNGILKSFITRIEYLVDHKIKVIRCDNGTEFKDREMNQFCKMKDPKSSHDDGSKPSSDDRKKVDEDPSKESKCNDQEKQDNVNNNNNVNIVSLTVNAAGINKVNAVGGIISSELLFDPNKPALEDVGIFNFSRDDEDDDAVADINNLDTTIQEEPKKTLVVLSNGKRAIGSKWVFSNKKDERGIVLRNKARLVAQGYTQEEGINYDEVFSLVARIEAIRLLLAYASFKDFVVYQIDVKSAFLYGKVEKEVYVCQPPGFEDPNFLDRVYKKFGFTKVKTASTPIETHKPPLKDEDGEKVDVHMYRSMIGSFMYLTSSRPDIMFTVCACARYQVNLKVLHLHAMKRIFRKRKKSVRLMMEKLFGMEQELILLTQSSAIPTDPHHTTTILQPSSQPQMKQKPKKPKRKDTQELGDSLVRDATTASSLGAEQDSGNITKTQSKATTNESCSQGINSGGGPWCQETIEDTIAQTRKGAENLAADQLSRLENPHQSDPKKKEITKTFPFETLGMATFRGDLNTQWFADIANYHAGNFIVKGMSSQQKKKLFKDMPKTWSHGVTLVNAKAKSCSVIRCLKMQFKFARSLTYGASTLWARSRLLEGTSTFSWPLTTCQNELKRKLSPLMTPELFVPQPSGPTESVANKAVYKELGDRLLRAATIASSLEVEQDSGNINKTQSKATPNESSSQGTNSGGGPRCQETIRDTTTQTRFESVSKHSNDSLLVRGNILRSDEDRLKLNELMAICTTLQNRVLDLKKTKTIQHNMIASLKMRDRSSKDEESLGKDASKQGRRIDADDEITMTNDADNEMFDVDDLDGKEVFVEGKNENVVEEVVDVAQVSAVATTTTITTEEITLAQALKALKTSKNKVKGIVFQEPEEPVKPKKKDQIRLEKKLLKGYKMSLMGKKDLQERERER